MLALFLVPCWADIGVSQVQTYFIALKEVLDQTETPRRLGSPTTNTLVSRWRAMSGTLHVEQTGGKSPLEKRITWGDLNLNCSIRPGLQSLVHSDGMVATVQQIADGKLMQDSRMYLSNVLGAIVVSLEPGGGVSRVTGLEANRNLLGDNLLRNVISLWVMVEEASRLRGFDAKQGLTLDSLLLPGPTYLKLGLQDSLDGNARRIQGRQEWRDQWRQEPGFPGGPNVSVKIGHAIIEAGGAVVSSPGNEGVERIVLELSGTARLTRVSERQRLRTSELQETEVEVRKYTMHLAMERR